MKLAPLFGSALALVVLAASPTIAADAKTKPPPPPAAPAHVAQVRALARSGVYDGRSFFRVIDNFMDQTGDPIDSGAGASALPNLQPEFTFKRGTDTPFGLVFRTNGVEEGFVGSQPVVSQTMDLGLLTADHRVQAWGTYCPGVLGMARGDDIASANKIGRAHV